MKKRKKTQSPSDIKLRENKTLFRAKNSFVDAIKKPKTTLWVEVRKRLI